MQNKKHKQNAVYNVLLQITSQLEILTCSKFYENSSTGKRLKIILHHIKPGLLK